jgi:hypothetical protein
MDLILHSIGRMLQTQLSMARFKLQVLRRYNVKFSKMRNFTLDMLRLEANQQPLDLQPKTLPLRHWYTRDESRILNKYKYFLPHLTDCIIFRANKYKVAENALRHLNRV